MYFPPSSANVIRSSEGLGTREFGFLARSGRAVLFPVHQGIFERRLAPRVRVPVLMENGRHDFNFPLDESQRPLFRLFGTPGG